MRTRAAMFNCVLSLVLLAGIGSASAQECSDVGAGLSWVTANVVNCPLGLGTITRGRAREVSAYTLPDLVIYQTAELEYEGDGACYGIIDTPLKVCEPTFSGPLGANTGSGHRMKMLSMNQDIVLATPIPGSPPVPGCIFGGEGEFFNQPIPFANCPDPPEQGEECEECECEPPTCSPILINVRGNQLELTDWSGGVQFDLNADGVAKQLSWTQGGSEDAFLALDRNGNGTIDDGTELFGNFTPQPPSPDPNGFIALAVYDLPSNGGNADGWISADDAVFSELELWTDSNHDGYCQPSELRTLASGRIQGINLDYRETRRTDHHGNAFRFSSSVRMEEHSVPRVRFAVDVFLLGNPPAASDSSGH